MKKSFFTFAAIILCVVILTIASSAATTYKDFNHDLTTDYSEVWFADIVYQGEIIGYGYLNYIAGYEGWWIFGKDSTVQTEFQNYSLPRNYGTSNGYDVKVYAYLSGGTLNASESGSWSDNDNKGGNTLGWISTEASIDNFTATYLTGSIRVTTPTTSNTYYYRVYDN